MSNMSDAAAGAKPVLALLLRRPGYLDEAPRHELLAIQSQLTLIAGSIDAHLEQTSPDAPTDMAGS